MRLFVFLSILLSTSLAFAQDLHFQTLSNLNEIRATASHDDTLWIGTDGGVQKRLSDGTLLATYTKNNGFPSNPVNNITIDHHGNKWFVGRRIITKFDNNSFTSFEIPDSLGINGALSIAIDSSENVWIGLNGGGILKYDGKNLERIRNNEQIIYSAIMDIELDSLGHLWFARLGEGIYMYDGSTFAKYDTSDGLIDNYVKDIEISAQGDIWIATENGLSRYNGQSWTNFDANSLPSSHVEDVFIENDKVWIATDLGVAYYDGTAWISLPDNYKSNRVNVMPDGSIWYWGYSTTGIISYSKMKGTKKHLLPTTIGSNTINKITTDSEGKLWLATNQGISCYDGKDWKNYKPEGAQYYYNTWDIAIDSEDGIWTATNQGLYYFLDGNWEAITTENGLPTNDIRSIEIDTVGNVWMGDYTNGIIKYDGSTFSTYTQENGLYNNYIESINIDKLNRILVGNLDGFSIFDGTAWITQELPNGGTTESVTFISIDEDQRTWVGTVFNGILIYENDRLVQTIDEKDFLGRYPMDLFLKGDTAFVTTDQSLSVFDGTSWKIYTYKDGLSLSYLRSVFVDANENLWIGGGGLSYTKLGANHEPTDIYTEKDTISSFLPTNSLITSLYTIDDDPLDVHMYEIVPTPSTDYEKVLITGNHLWLIEPFAKDQNTFHVRLRSTDGIGASIEKLITLQLSQNPLITSTHEEIVNPVAIYPVPTKEELFIKGIPYDSHITLLDLQGRRQKIYRLKDDKQGVKLNIQHLPAGIYILHISSSGQTHSFRIVKQ